MATQACGAEEQMHSGWHLGKGGLKGAEALPRSRGASSCSHLPSTGCGTLGPGDEGQGQGGKVLLAPDPWLCSVHLALPSRGHPKITCQLLPGAQVSPHPRPSTFSSAASRK